MVLSDEEANALAANSDFQKFRNGHSLKHAIEHSQRDAVATQLLEQQIKVDYLRTTHARGDVATSQSRLAYWLQRIEQIIERKLKFRGRDFNDHLELLGLSHGQDAGLAAGPNQTAVVEIECA